MSAGMTESFTHQPPVEYMKGMPSPDQPKPDNPEKQRVEPSSKATASGSEYDQDSPAPTFLGMVVDLLPASRLRRGIKDRLGLP